TLYRKRQDTSLDRDPSRTHPRIPWERTFEMNSKPCRFAYHMCHSGSGRGGFRQSAAGVDTNATEDFPFD
ncbi:MAG TPA: hypothetical protein VMI06_01805, partial [Terriglobia bacterium]|nr:hypothetical protein [Terriglobia bacterium]